MKLDSKPDRPISLQAFMRRFPDDAACADHLARKRWPEGFRCPACPSEKGWKLDAKPWTWECAACHKRTLQPRQFPDIQLVAWTGGIASFPNLRKTSTIQRRREAQRVLLIE